MTNTQCTIAQSVVEAAPYNLVFGDDIFVRVTATNAKGSTTSDPGSGCKVIRAPDAPTSLAEDTAQRTPTVLALTWSPASEDGGS